MSTSWRRAAARSRRSRSEERRGGEEGADVCSSDLRHANPLPLAAGEFVRVAAEIARFHVDFLEKGGRPLAALEIGRAAGRGRGCRRVLFRSAPRKSAAAGRRRIRAGSGGDSPVPCRLPGEGRPPARGARDRKSGGEGKRVQTCALPICATQIRCRWPPENSCG